MLDISTEELCTNRALILILKKSNSAKKHNTFFGFFSYFNNIRKKAEKRNRLCNLITKSIR